jgi:hypothetical protein
LSGTLYLHVTLLVLAVWAAPHVARWAQPAAAEKERGASEGGRFRLVAQGLLVGSMLACVLVYLRGQTAFIYFQF